MKLISFFAVAVFMLFGCGVNDATAGKEEGVKVQYKAGSKAGVVGKIGDREITESELISEDASELYELENRVFEFKDAKFRDLVQKEVIGSEAKKANMSVEDYITKKITDGGKKIKTSDSEIKKFAEERRIPADKVDQLKDRIKEFLGEEKKRNLVDEFVSKQAAKNKLAVESYVFKPSRPKFDVKVRDTAFVRGSKDAKVEIVEFSDFQCPYCSRGAQSMEKVVKKYGKKIKFVFQHFPLAIHPDAPKASEAAECAGEQGKFWEMHDRLFANQEKIKEADLKEHAKALKLKTDKFDECLSSGRTAALIKADMEQAEKLKVRSTPTFFINGQLVMGALPPEEFEKIIDEELAKAK